MNLPNEPSEQLYPIQTTWVVYSSLGSLISLIILGFAYILPTTAGITTSQKNTDSYSFYFVIFTVSMIISFIYKFLSKSNFHFALTDQYLNVHSGILSKQNRNIPYGIIQNVLLKQGLLDRIFGLATLRIENAAQAGGVLTYTPKSANRDSITSHSNFVSIPGLKKTDAESLKNLVLEKMKQNPIQEQGI